MLGASSATCFGQSPFDCGNRQPREVSEVWVGTYRRSMILNFDDRLAGWQPMDRSDSILTRIEDVAQALGRSAAHEVGHSLGLVGCLPDEGCAWMGGCDDFHNCEEFQDRFSKEVPHLRRFSSGQFIMDPGAKTTNWARLGEPLMKRRSQERSPATFNTFDRSYLRIVLPGR